jgi:hypothetical protein
MSMTDMITVNLHVDFADEIAIAWLEDKIKIKRAGYRANSVDKLEDDEDYKALLRVYEYVAGEEYDWRWQGVGGYRKPHPRKRESV